MSSPFNPYASTPVIEAPVETRTDFVRKTYWHLAGSIAAFGLLESFLMSVVPARTVFGLLSSTPFSWLLVLLAFTGASSLASRWAASGASQSKQYAGLGLYVIAEAVIFLPMLMLAARMENGAIGKAAVVTGGMVLGLTCIAFTTRKDFTFLSGFIKIACIVATVLIVASFFIPGLLAGMGTWFSVAMIIVMSCSILNQTSRIMYYYSPGQHVAAALALFASVATLFWYVLRLFMRRN
jgi:FtsH-binding integral membrane protein